MTKFKVTRTVSLEECPWLEREIKAGETVYEYHGFTYGCVSDGIAVTQEPGATPFFELPANALDSHD